MEQLQSEYNLHRYVYNSQYFNFSFFCLVLSQDTKTPVPYTWKIGGDVFVEYMMAQVVRGELYS